MASLGEELQDGLALFRQIPGQALALDLVGDPLQAVGAEAQGMDQSVAGDAGPLVRPDAVLRRRSSSSQSAVVAWRMRRIHRYSLHPDRPLSRIIPPAVAKQSVKEGA